MDQHPTPPAAPAAPGAPKNSNAKFIFLALAGVAVVGLIAVVFFVMSIFKLASGPSNAGKAFVNALAENDYAAAYEMTSPEFREVTAQEDLQLFVEAFPVIDEMTSISFNQFSIENDAGVVSGTIAGAGETSPITIEVVNVNGEWKIVNLSLDPADVPTGDDETMEDDSMMIEDEGSMMEDEDAMMEE